MKVLRLIYLCTCYIIGIPLLLVLWIPTFLVTSIICKIQYGEFGFKDGIYSLYYGVIEGHRINMLFVKYGRNGYDSEVEL